MTNGGCSGFQNFCRNVIHRCGFFNIEIKMILETSNGFTGLKENWCKLEIFLNVFDTCMI